jgi:hypothetical protein
MVRFAEVMFAAAIMVVAAVGGHAQTVTGGQAPLPTPKVAASGLPTCTAALEGQIYEVTDALLPAALAVVAGGGAVRVLVFCNGSTWIVL